MNEVKYLKAVFAGILVAIASMNCLTITVPYLGAILFGIALVIICSLQYDLFTGKIGYIKNLKDLKKYIIILLGNVIGALLIGIVAQEAAVPLVIAKLSNPLWLTFWKACGCGFLMYTAVQSYKKTNSFIGISYCIPTFVIAGFEHCIADIYYIIAARAFSIESLIFILVVILGNSIGAKFVNIGE